MALERKNQSPNTLGVFRRTGGYAGDDLRYHHQFAVLRLGLWWPDRKPRPFVRRRFQNLCCDKDAPSLLRRLKSAYSLRSFWTWPRSAPGRLSRPSRLHAFPMPRKYLNTGQSVWSAAFSVSDLESNRLAGI